MDPAVAAADTLRATDRAVDIMVVDRRVAVRQVAVRQVGMLGQFDDLVHASTIISKQKLHIARTMALLAVHPAGFTELIMAVQEDHMAVM